MRVPSAAILAIAFLTVGASFAVAQAEDPDGPGVQEVLKEIRDAQGLGPQQSIDPDAVSPELLGKLGEAVMSLMVPDPRQHELMDRMMGGEGSESLASMHQLMGYRYLSGYAPYGGMGGTMGGFGPGMMGPGMMTGPGMMGPYGGGLYAPRRSGAHMFWGTILPWSLTGVLAVAVTALTIVLVTR